MTTQQLSIGLGKVDITPPIGATLVGYTGRISTSVDIPLYAEVLVCRKADAAWALVTCDVLGFSAGLVARIRRAVASQCALSAASLMISVTHTHSGPNTISRECSESELIDHAYREDLIQKLSVMIVQAFEHAEPSTLRYTQFEASALAHNRRIQDADKKWINEWADHEGRHPGFVDNHVSLLAVYGADTGLRALLINYACHPVTLGPGSLAISPDYVGYLKKELAEIHGINQIHFCLAGCANLNPRHCINLDSAETERMGKALAQQVSAYVKGTQEMKDSDLVSRQLPWEIRRTRERPKEKQMKDEQSVIKTEFQMFGCDDFAIVSVPGELFCEFNGRIRERSAYPCTMVASITNDYIGYLLTDEGLRQGAYEARMSPADNLESEIIEKCASLLGKLTHA